MTEFDPNPLITQLLEKTPNQLVAAILILAGELAESKDNYIDLLQSIIGDTNVRS